MLGREAEGWTAVGVIGVAPARYGRSGVAPAAQSYLGDVTLAAGALLLLLRILGAVRRRKLASPQRPL